MYFKTNPKQIFSTSKLFEEKKNLKKFDQKMVRFFFLDDQLFFGQQPHINC